MTARERYVDHRSSVRRSLTEIDEIIALANEQEDLVVQANLMGLAVVRLSGFIEQSFGAMVRGYLAENTSHRVLKFSTRQAGRLANLNPTKLEQLVASFDDEWRVVLHNYLDQDENRQTLGNLIEARHKLAHGTTTRVSPKILHEYHRVAKETVTLLFDLFLPLPAAAV